MKLTITTLILWCLMGAMIWNALDDYNDRAAISARV